MSNQESQIDNLYDEDSLDCSLSEAFTDKGSFIINQYKNPLLLNIGLGIRNLAFMGKNEIKRSNAITGEDEIEEPEENDSSIILLEDKEQNLKQNIKYYINDYKYFNIIIYRQLMINIFRLKVQIEIKTTFLHLLKIIIILN